MVHSIVHVCENVYEIEHELIYEVYAIPNVICSVIPKCEGGWMRMLNKYVVESKAKPKR